MTVEAVFAEAEKKKTTWIASLCLIAVVIGFAPAAPQQGRDEALEPVTWTVVGIDLPAGEGTFEITLGEG